NMVIAGVGLGLMMQVFVLAVQNAVPRSRIGSATAVTQFSRSIGATLGVTLMGVIVNQGLPRGVSNEGVAVHRLQGPLRVGLAHALRPAFLAALLVSALVLPIVLVGIRDVRLRHGFEDVVVGDEPSPQPATAAYGDVVHTFVNRSEYEDAYLPGYRAEQSTNGADGGVGLLAIDHVVGNVELGRMQFWVEFYERVFGMTEMIHFSDEDISTEY